MTMPGGDGFFGVQNVTCANAVSFPHGSKTFFSPLAEIVRDRSHAV
jgi:hypothetical protein